MLEEVGKTKILDYDWAGQPIIVKVIMAIKAPRGECQIFEAGPRQIQTQCEAIKAFMEQYKAKSGG